MAPKWVRKAAGELQLKDIKAWLNLTNRQSDEGPLSAGPIFIAIDVEKWEHGHENIRITEVGVSVLDPEKLQGLSLDDNAIAWQEKVETRHLRIKENSHKRFVNRKYVDGHPENFLFGTSEFVQLSHVPSILRSICVQAAKKGDTLRPVVFVGHAVHNDINDMQALGWSPNDIQNLIGTVDTQYLALACELREKLEYLTSSLLGYWPDYCHNAGNDAHYTMLDMMLMGVQDSSKAPEPDSVSSVQSSQVWKWVLPKSETEPMLPSTVKRSWAAVAALPVPNLAAASSQKPSPLIAPATALASPRIVTFAPAPPPLTDWDVPCTTKICTDIIW